MSTVKVVVNCCMCPTKEEVEVQVPDGWLHRYGVIEEERSAFCPAHAAIDAFTHDQCPGCVGGWGDCGLWSAFAYSGRRSLTADDFAALEHGICPKRTNGTFMVSRGRGVQDMNISEKSTDESGSALAQAIKDYWERYPEEATR